ncbi:MAG: hypothetical protein HY958_11095 [Bacteroidia bacterium]|nr:hypothetical protein [Bacteroidia bacterium]
MCKIGIDLGSSFTKGVLINAHGLIARSHIVKTGFDFNLAAKKIIEKLSENSEIEYPVYTCGYGREQIDLPSVSNSEITALAKAVFTFYQKKCTVIDIGGQDTKFIKITSDGKVEKFKVNRKCAAGTGSFLEEIAYRMDVPPSEFRDIAEKATDHIKINSYCTVFAVSEIIGMIKKGITLPNIILGIYNSIVDRCMEISHIDDFLVITGGIPVNHPKILSLFKNRFPNCESPDHAQIMAAWGSVLLNI